MARLLKPEEKTSLPTKIDEKQICMVSNGDGVQQIGYVEKAVTNVIIAGGSDGRTAKAMKGRQYSEDIYHLFCIGVEEYDKSSFVVPADRALTECIAQELKDKYSPLNTPEIIDELLNFPALFTCENHHYASTDPEHRAHFGIVTDIKVRENGIQIYFQKLTSFQQQLLNENAFELGFSERYFKNELNRTHWTLKRINLVEILHDAYIPVVKLS